MLPGKMDLAIYRGDSYKWAFTLWTNEAKTVAADLTGASASAEFRVGPGTAVLMTLTGVITMPNIITLTLTAANSAALPPNAKWDLQVTQGINVTTIVAGAVTVTSDITGSTGALLMAAAAPQTIRRVI